MDDGPPIAEQAVMALVTQLYRMGAIREADIEAMCAAVDDETAHQLRCCILEAEAPGQREWEAGQARRRFTLIEGGEE